jgi:DNA-binding transcriptional MocR family regulator
MRNRLINHLNNQLPVKNKKATQIAFIIAKFFLEGKLAFGFKLPPQRELAAEIKVKLAVIVKAWEILLGEYQIIEAWSGHGTYLIAELTEEKRRILTNRIKMYNTGERVILMDRETVLEEDKLFQQQLTKSYSEYKSSSKLRFTERLLSGLIPELAKRLSAALAYSFEESQVYYMDDYKQMAVHIAEIMVVPKKRFLVVKPGSEVFQNALLTKRNINFIAANPGHDWLAELEAECMKGDVGGVYFSCSSVFPDGFKRDQEVMDRLLDLYTKYGFNLLFDNPFPLQGKPPLLNHVVHAAADQYIVYSCHATFLDGDIASATVVSCTAERIINQLQKKYKGRSTQLPPVIAHTLLYFLKSGRLQKFEHSGLKVIASLVEAAKAELFLSNDWKKDLILQQQGAFFYLEPASGRFPRDVYTKLAEQNVFIMNSFTYRSGRDYADGVLISISHYNDEKLMLIDLRKLIVLLNRMIIYSIK